MPLLILLCSHSRLLLCLHLHHPLLMLLLLLLKGLRIWVCLHHLMLHRHISHLHLRRHLLVECRISWHHTSHALLLCMQPRHHLLSHHNLLLLLWIHGHLVDIHLRILLLKHLLLGSEMRHSHWVMHGTARRRCSWTLWHSCHHWTTLSDLRTRYSWMTHSRHHSRRWRSSHMCSSVMLHPSHRMARTSHTRMCLSHTGRKRLSHHDRWL